MTPVSRRRSVLLTLLLALTGCVASSPGPQAFDPAPDVALSEDTRVAARLEASLRGFLEALHEGELSESHTSADDRERHGFFYSSLRRGARGAEPRVLKSYPLGAGAYAITLAFFREGSDGLTLPLVAELDATPTEDGYLLACAYPRRTRDLEERRIRSVTYRYRGPFDEARAEEFVQFKERLESLRGRDTTPLVYDRFSSLEGLLLAHGLVFDASKCNFLRHDLGYLWEEGQRFSTGTGDESYVFGYARGALSDGAPGQTYGPYLNGVAAYFGGYGLSGESVDVLAQQFRDELERRPDLDFLEEFRKGRGSSVQRHFSHYVMCAFLCREIAARHGERAALQPIASGAEGERFFEHLHSLLGVDERNFHATIESLIREG